jgi:hypothetical protein
LYYQDYTHSFDSLAFPPNSTVIPSSTMASLLAGETKLSTDSEKALPFITLDPDTNKFEMHDEACAVLNNLKCPVAVVTVAGMYRTGKSYLLNLLKAAPNSTPEPAKDGFSVGHTVNAHTKGIWLWGEPVRIDDQDVAVVFLDTEGLGSVGASQTHDSRIFALALLIGSYFIYNSRGVIDGNAIENLSLVVNLTKHIHVSSKNSGEEDSGSDFSQHFPTFMWVVRDFTLQLKSATGRAIPPKTYLEKALKPEQESDETVVQKNQVRMMLSNFFRDRDCVPLVRPVSDEAQLRDLSACPWGDLREEFRSGIETLRRKLYGKVRPKEMYGKLITGPMLVNLSASYVDAINTGGVPTISSAWERVVESQCADAADEAFGEYQSQMRAAQRPSGGTADEGGTQRHVRNGVKVLEAQPLADAHQVATDAAEAMYDRQTVQTVSETSLIVSGKAKAQLRKDIKTAWLRIVATNERASHDLCTDVLKKLERERQDGERQRRKAGSGTSVGLTGGKGRTASFNGQVAELRRLRAERDAVRAKLAKSNSAKKDSDSGSNQDGSSGKSDSSSGSSKSLDIGKTLQQFKEDVDRVVSQYLDEAAGPSKDDVLRKYLLGTVMPNVVSTGVEGARQQMAKIKELQEQTMTKTNEVTAALTKTNEIRKQMTEKMSSQKAAYNEQLQNADLDKRNTVAMFEAKLSEANSRESHAQEMQDTIKSQVTRLEDELKQAKTDAGKSTTAEKEWLERERTWHADERRLREQASKASFELEALQREKSTTDSVTERETQRRLQELRDRHRKEVDRVHRENESASLALESRLKENNVGASSAETQSLRNQLRDAQGSVDTLNQHVDLLTETLGVTKDLLAAKTQEVGECEYQWAAAKAKLAQCESDKMEHEADVVHVLEPIVSQIKRLVSLEKEDGSV